MLLNLPSFGQEVGASNVQEPVQFRLMTMASISNFFYENDGEKERIYATPSNFSPLYTAPEDRQLIFYNEVPSPKANEPKIKVIVAKIKLPAGEGPFLIILKPDESSPGSLFDSYVIDHSLSAHPGNVFRTFNFSKRRMAVQLADQNILLNKGSSETVPYPDNGKAWLKVAADSEGEGWLKVKSMPYSVGSNSRTTIFIMDIPPSERDPNPKGVSVRKVRERIYEDEFGVQRIR